MPDKGSEGIQEEPFPKVCPMEHPRDDDGLTRWKRRFFEKTVRLPNGGVLLLGGSLTKYSLFLMVFSQLGSSDKEPIK